MNKHESELIGGRKVILSNTFFPDIFGVAVPYLGPARNCSLKPLLRVF